MIKSGCGFIDLKAYFKMTASFLNSAKSIKSYWNLKTGHDPYVVIWKTTDLATEGAETRDRGRGACDWIETAKWQGKKKNSGSIVGSHARA